jgi:hypothetical protein
MYVRHDHCIRAVLVRLVGGVDPECTSNSIEYRGPATTLRSLAPSDALAALFLMPFSRIGKECG